LAFATGPLDVESARWRAAPTAALPVERAVCASGARARAQLAADDERERAQRARAQPAAAHRAESQLNGGGFSRFFFSFSAGCFTFKRFQMDKGDF
jgi:hypothetical protein